MNDQERIIDQWSSVSYKFGSAETAQQIGGVSWLQPIDRRRLAAYSVLSSYVENVARYHVAADVSEDERDERREYGDPSLLVAQVTTHLMGEDQQIIVAGAEEAAATAEDGNDPDAARAEARQDQLRQWADDEQLALRLIDGETTAVGMGDSVYVLEWDAERGRPRLGVIDPGFYFPVLNDDGLLGNDYPRRVHFAWEIEPELTDDRKRRVRRITYELLRTPGQPVQYPWNDKPSEWQCYLTDATWVMSSELSGGLDRFELSKAQIATMPASEVGGEPVELLRYPLGIDFLPVIHVPNTSPGTRHYGQSVLAKVLQSADDLQNADTDASKAAATTGSPMIAVDSALNQAELAVSPGAVFSLRQGGQASVLDTSQQLERMQDYQEYIRTRMNRTARVPDVALGVPTDDAAQMSGISLLIQWGPLEGLVRALRKTRAPKFRLLLKFVQRMMLAHGQWQDDQTVHEARIEYGSFMPRDVAGTMEVVARGVRDHVLSVETGVRMLIAAGVPIEDAVREVELIERRAFDWARDAADATGDASYARRMLDGEPDVEQGAAPPGQQSVTVQPGAATAVTPPRATR